ncbi:MAG: 2-C-methyl-D-erythritol 2,4-cyclodiphosphate synthase [Eubacteriales bacterium]|jgi:2-C-methyl-D-erythritol 2,4-cyclodiphosphate synthase|nr:2-C-methyl-D-erythritol 2,4-cyclodiphosphate synthase [Eubacteriales bacterium]MDD3196977.1 2-C-methyl-D-erythritol 2,4-cyclodiphosphate synthase [Eubacteriales bacterium]MDD4681752.1 2-C-methyl-D-erythritol 2,4-cyclodiphosphate synthase [Eubacteriales bacterium]
MSYIYVSTIGQDSHRFCSAEEQNGQRELVLGGLVIPGEEALAGNSDADVVLHALTNAVSGLTGINVLGASADKLCLDQGITDSREYLKLALADLGKWQICHISISIEAKKPKLMPWIDDIRKSVADLFGITAGSVTMTATTGEGLTDFGRGLGMQALCIISARKPDTDI